MPISSPAENVIVAAVKKEGILLLQSIFSGTAICSQVVM
jgi:hypothetical protein